MSLEQSNCQGVYPNEQEIKSQMLENFLTDSDIVPEFAKQIASFLSSQRSMRMVSSPHVALVGALRLLQLQPGEEVLCPVYWRRDYADCLLAMQLRPVFVEVTPHNMSLDPLLLGNHLERLAQTGAPLPRVLIVCHAHGIPSNMPRVMQLADQYRITVIEDCTQALGAQIAGRSCGTWGALSLFSFRMGEVVQGGSGGCLTWADNRSETPGTPYQTWPSAAIRDLDDWLSPYAMPPLVASAALPQLERLGAAIERKRQIAKLYQKYISQVLGIRYLQWQEPEYAPNYGCQTIYIEPAMVRFSVAELQAALAAAGFAARQPPLQLLSELPSYRRCARIASGVAESMAHNLLYLPNDPILSGVVLIDIIEIIRRLVFKYNS